LRREQIELRATLSASEALAWVAAEAVAVLVSDDEMPAMTGAQLAGQARRLRPETVRILLTGKRTLAAAVDGIDQDDIFRFLNKPFDGEQFRAAVRSGVSQNRELVEMSGDRQRHERREALRAALEAEYPGISDVGRRTTKTPYLVTDDPWAEALALGLTGLPATLEV
jgi:DNA-binding NtrC family response regulator